MNLFTLSSFSLVFTTLLQLLPLQFGSSSMELSNLEPDPLLYQEGQGPVLLTSSLEVNAGSDSLVAATVWISANLRSCEDSLNVSEHPDILAAYDANTGTLSLLGAASAAEYQTLLRTVTYTNTNASNPFQVPRTIEFQVHSATENSNAVSRQVNVLGALDGPFHLPYTESFETNGNGTRYEANSFNDSGANFFDRLQSGSGQLANDPSNINGAWFWAGEDVSDVIGIPSNNCQNGNPHPSGHGRLRLANLLAFGYANLEVSIALAVGQEERFGPSDGLLVQYAFDADIDTETYTTIGAFYGDDPDDDSGNMRQDLDLDGEADPAGPILDFTLTDYTFSIPDAGSLLSVRIVMTQNAGNEELIFDHIRVNGLFQCFAEAGQVTGSAQTVCPGDTITVGIQNQQTDPAYVQTFLLADPAGNILDIQTSGAFALPVGTFTVYSYNYHGAGSAPTNPATLASINCLDHCCDLVAANFQVSASDAENPIAACLPSLIVELDANGTASLQPDQLDAGSTDNCSITSRSLSQSSFDCNHVGAQSILLTVSDAQGNQDTCSTQVLISDAVPPALVCQNASLVLDETGHASITAADLLESASDACGIESYDLSINAFTCEHLGSNTVVVSANDVNGNSWGCTATVTVADQTAPVVFCKNLIIYLDSLGLASISVPDVNSGITEACEIDSVWLTQTLFECSDLGSNIVLLYASDNSGNEGFCQATITVLDTIQPFIACPTNQVITADANCQGLLPDYTGATTDLYDNCPSGLLISQIPSAGNMLGYPATQVVLTATDEAGNNASCQFLVTLQDQTPPNALCQNATVYLDAEGLATLMPTDLDGGSTDACGIDTISVSQVAFTCAHTGLNLLTLTVTDLEGNSATCESEVTVLDTVAPLALCQDITVQLNEEGAYTLNPALVNDNSFDACGIDQLSVSPSTFDCNSIGLQAVTLTVTDYFGNSSQCTAEVLVQDITAPVALCQNIIVQLDASGNASINGLNVDNGSSDACGLASLLVSPNTFTCANLGENTVTLTATDLYNNSASCEATVTVQDSVAPVAVCQDITVQLDADGNASIQAIELDGGSSDACGLDVWSASMTEFTCAQVGNNTVTLTVSDASGNSASCTAQVQVLDEVAPLASCQNITVALSASGQVTITGAQVNNGSSDACGVGSLSVTPSSFSCASVGPNEVVLTVADLNGNLSTCTATVTIVDQTPPSAQCQDVTITLNAAGTFTLLDVAVNAGSTDACGLGGFFLSQTEFSCLHVGANPVVLTVTDIHNNSDTCSAIVTVLDGTAPVAQCQDVTLVLEADGTALLQAADLDAGSLDACGLDSLILNSYLFDCSQVGANTVTLTVFDPSGNSASCQAIVTVVDETNPTATCQDITLALNPDGHVNLPASLVDNGSSDACGLASLSVSPANFTCAEVGVNVVTLSVTDVNGLTSTCQSEVHIVDQTPPAALCQDITVQLNSIGRVQVQPTSIDAGSNDACGIAQIVLSQTQFECEHLGDNTVVLTVIDAYGNESACTATITVEDNILPQALCQDITVSLDSDGQISLAPDAVDAGSNDNCETLDYQLSKTLFDCSQVGVNPVTMTVTDLGGNSASCSALVSVIASAACIAPEIVNMGGPTIADPCSCLSNGQFAEEVMVTAGNGQNWTIVSTTLLHPVTLLPFPAGTALIETVQIPGESIYTLAGVHLDGQGYSITVSSPFYPGVQLSISNTCYYPEPQIIGLSGPYCINTAPIPLVGEVGGVALVSEGFTINGNPATVFAPGQLGIGTHTVVYTVNAGTAGSNDPSDPGCVASASQTLQVVVTPSVLACNNFLNISVDENCEAFITPDMILEGSNYLCYDDYGVTVKLGINTIPNPIPGTYLGQQLTVTITHLPSGNSCMSTILLSDNLAPVFDCPTTPVVIACTEAVGSVPPPQAFDNCTPVSVVLVDEFVDDSDPCDDGKVRIHRIWRAVDTYNNESGTCLQVVEVERPDEVDFPNDIIWECDQESSYPGILAAGPLHPSILAAQMGVEAFDATGITSASVLANTGSGTPLGIDGPYCNYAYSHSDLVVPGCGNSFDIVRTWTVIDWCTGLLVTSNSAGENNVQLIRVVDDTPPQIVRAPFDLSASIPGDPVHNPCTSQGLLLPPTVTDNCNTTTIRIFTPVGEAVYVNGQNGSNGGFVPAPGLPLGIHLILYQAEDACGNIAELYVPVEVVDDISPTAICKQVTTVSLSSNGLGVVPAINFDNGSFDNCCLDYLEVRRQDGDCAGNPDDFGPNVTFCCSDIGNSPIMVVLRIVDCYGNFNQCMVEVNVEDKLPPVTVTCPGPQTINCDAYLDELAAELSFGNYAVLDPFGTPSFFDNCSFTVQQDVQVAINTCQEGTITRFWTANDPNGNSAATCTQIITVEHVSDWVVQFPADIILECNNGGLPPFGEPQVFFDNCEMVGTSFSDQTFYTVPDACYMIVRTWTVVNWCLYDEYGFNAFLELSEAQVGQDFNGDGLLNSRTFKDGVNNAGIPDGYMVYQQVIKIVDNDAPAFQVDDLEVCILGTGCSTTVNLPVPSVSDCNPSSSISITSNLPNPVGGNPYQYQNVPPGSYTATYAVSDLCGNTAFQTIQIDVTDCKKPSPICVNGLVVEIMQTGMIDVSASAFNAGSFDNCSGDLLISFSANVADTLQTFDCDMLGFQPIEMWVTDAAGNQDFCATFVNIQDNMGVCTSMPIIAGRIHTEMDLSVANVMVDVNGGSFSQMTGTDGMYEFELPFLGDYTVVPSHDANHVNGVTTLDLLFIKQHILGINLLNSPYKMIAADVNNSKHITTLDMLVAQQLILGMIDQYPNNSSWRFVPASYSFPNPANPWQEIFPEFLSFNNLSADMLDADFVAVKIGDVNNSAQPNADAPAEDRNLAEGLVLELPNRMLEAGETVRVPFAASASEALGYQFTLEFDTDALEFVELEEGLAGRDQFGLRYLSQGHITTNWHTDVPQTLYLDEPLFALYFTAKKAVALEEVLRLAAQGRTKAESYLSDMQPRSLSWVFRSDAEAGADNFVLYQNVPNPFAGSTVVGFRLPEGAQVSLRVTDVSGRLLRLVEGYFEAGYHEINLRDLPGSGVLFYRLDAGGYSATRKMVAE